MVVLASSRSAENRTVERYVVAKIAFAQPKGNARKSINADLVRNGWTPTYHALV